MKNQKSLRRNISLEYLYTVLFHLDFTRGLWMIYLASKGMSLMQLGLLESIFHVTSFFMEIPTGVVADIFGRKASRIVGRLLAVASLILIYTGDGFEAYAFAFVITAFSYNFESGAGEALVYDSLKQLEISDLFMKLTGRRELIYQLTSTVAFITGGWLATISYKWVYMLSIIFAIFAFIEGFFFTEPDVGKTEVTSITESMKNQLVVSLKAVKERPRIAYLYFSVNSLIAFITTLFFYLQNHFKSQGMLESEIGVILAVASIGGAFAGVQAWRLEKKFGNKVLLRVLPAFMSVGLWIMALTRFEAAAFFYLSALDGIIYVVTRDYINKLIPSDQRATLLSVDSMIFSFNMIILFPVVGKLGDVFSLKTAFMVMACYSVVIVLSNLFMLNRLEKHEASL